MMSRDKDGKEIVQVGTWRGDPQWLYRDKMNESGRAYVTQFESAVKIKTCAFMPAGECVPIDKLPERHRPKYIKGVDIVDPDAREPADPVWQLMSFLQLLEEHKARKEYFAISAGELEEAESRFQETDDIMAAVDMDDYNGEELNKTSKKRKFQPGRPLTTSQLDALRKAARNYVPSIDRKVRGRKYDKTTRALGGLKVVETAASSTRSWIKDEEDPDYDEDEADDYEGDQSEAEETSSKFKKSKTLKSALFQTTHF